MQARAEATRRAIVDSAVNLFDTVGYVNVSLADLIACTGASKGAFYYHFANREAVAAAIIAEAETRMRDTITEVCSDPAYRSLEHFVRMVFAVAELTRRDTLVRLGIELRGGLSHISPVLDGFAHYREMFTSVMSSGIAEGDLRSDLDADQAGFTLWTAILGTHQHCAATGDDLDGRLTDVLTLVLPAICTPESTPHYSEFVRQAAAASPATRSR